MFKNKFKKLFTLLFILTGALAFIGADCGTDAEDGPPPLSNVAAPTNANVSLGQASGFFATITWDKSPDNGDASFSGYRVNTYRLDTNNNIVAQFGPSAFVPKDQTALQPVNNLTPETRYITYITAEAQNNVKSDSIATKVYAAVYENSGEIDEYQLLGSAESGFGWNEFGIGTQYSFSQGNSAEIDLHVRDQNGLKFFSPDQFSPGTNVTWIGLIGAGEDAFRQTDLDEPTLNNIAVVADNVYLIKTAQNIYVKIWVESIDNSSGYQTIMFDYKLQPIEGLRVLKASK